MWNLNLDKAVQLMTKEQQEEVGDKVCAALLEAIDSIPKKDLVKMLADDIKDGLDSQLLVEQVDFHLIGKALSKRLADSIK